MRDLLFSAEGRIGRAGFWKGAVLLVGLAILVAIALFLMTKSIPGEPTTDGSFQVHGIAAIPYVTLVFGYLAVSAWAGICLGVKRFHDRGKSGVWILIQFVPFIGVIWYFIEAGCLPGTAGPNAYGDDPSNSAFAAAQLF